MTKNSGGPIVNPGGERDGDAAKKGEKPRGRGETSPADDRAAIDVDTAHDRAS
jgi:hypothetical protein